MNKILIALLTFSVLGFSSVEAQVRPVPSDKNKDKTNAEIIYLENPSFEDIPRAGIPPSAWFDCGPAGETPPDVQPYGGFRVTRTPQQGNTYLGLVTRDNNTTEAVGQRLSKPMRQNQCYDFSLYLARSATYESATKRNQTQLFNFNKGVTLRIWVGNSLGERAEMLAHTEVIENTEWEQIKVKLTPTKRDYQYICIEAYYKTPVLFPYNGNILVDNLSPISACDVPVVEIAKVDTPPKKVNVNPKPTVTTPSVTTTTPSVKVDTTKEADKGDFKSDLRTQDLKIGDIFRLQNLYFPADSASITKVSENTLNELYAFLKKNPNVIIEIGGHTNGLPEHAYCDKLSSARAKTVAEYLTKKGIPSQQIQHKGYGKRKPIESDGNPYGRERNQRVEIKILNIK
jgi:outer membrane protein OmpA-like peptidoglycan-associated protein